MFLYRLKQRRDAVSSLFAAAFGKLLIVDILQNGDKTMDDLALETNMESGRLLGTLMKLEMKFVILKNPDRSYRLR